MDPKIAVLCPHPDDFEIGFAIGVRRLLLSGWRVKLIYLTDGRYGVEKNTAEAVAIRRVEAAVARKMAGIDDYYCFDIEDGTLPKIYSEDEHMKLLMNKLEELVHGYDVLVSPTLSDMHPDHIATAKIAKELQQASGVRAIIRYMVWLYPDFYLKELEVLDRIIALDLSNDDMDLKLKLIKCHESQVNRRPYDLIAKCRDEYLARLFNFKNYCEVAGISCKYNNLYTKLLKSLSPVHEISSYLPGVKR